MTWTAATIVALLAPMGASAQTIGLRVSCDGRAMPCEGVESVAWHALYNVHGHEPLLVPSGNIDPAAQLVRAHISTLLDVTVTWDAQSWEATPGEPWWTWAPVVRIDEHQVVAGELHKVRHWYTWGAIALFQNKLMDDEMLALPQPALQSALDLAVGPVAPPTWRTSPTRVDVPITLAADDEYRAFYGSGWTELADARVARASALLAPAGIRLVVTEHLAWTSPGDTEDLSELLDALDRDVPARGGAIRVGLTQQTALAHTWESQVEDVGRAFLTGTAVVVGDQAALPGQALVWDEAAEATALAHEVLHALGVPHRPESAWLMSAEKAWSTVHLHPQTQRLAAAAAAARFSDQDPEVALARLAAVAPILRDERQRLGFVARTMALGPGVPDPGLLADPELASLTSAALEQVNMTAPSASEHDVPRPSEAVELSPRPPESR